MSKTPRKNNSGSTAATVEKTTGVPDDVVVTTSTTSEPSGLRAPDGANSDENDATPVDPSTEASQGDAEGTGANAGPDLPAFDLDGVLVATGTASLEHLIRVSAIGKQTLVIIEDISSKSPRYQNWLGEEKPAEIIVALVEEVDLLYRTIDLLEEKAEDDEPLVSSEKHPLTRTLLGNWRETRQPVIRITSKVAGFRRGGIAHPAQADHPIRTFTPDQLEAILGEANLTVELV